MRSGRSGRWRWWISPTDSSTGTRSPRGKGSRRRSSRTGSCGSRRRVRRGDPTRCSWRGHGGWPQPARPQRRQSGVRGVRAVRPWRVAVGLTMTDGALAVWALWLELAHLRPYGPVRSASAAARSGGSSRQCSTSSPPVPVPTPNGPRCNGPARRPPGLVVRRPRRRWVLAPDVSRRRRARSTPSSGRSASRRVISAPRTNHRGTPTRRAGTPSSGWRNG